MAGVVNRLMTMEYIIAASHFPSVRREICAHPLSRNDTQLFQAMMAGEHCIRGLSNAEYARVSVSPVLDGALFKVFEIPVTLTSLKTGEHPAFRPFRPGNG